MTLLDCTKFAWKYDVLDRKIEKKYPDNNTLTQSFGVSTVSKEIETATVIDELGRATTTHGDAYGRTVQVDEQFGAGIVSTRYEYDLFGRLTRLKDHLLNEWNYTYDTLGRRIQAVDPDLGSWNYTYDDAARLALQTDGVGPTAHRTVPATTSPVPASSTSATRPRPAMPPAASTTTSTTRAGRADLHRRRRHATDLRLTSAYDLGGRLLSQTYPDSDSVGPLGYDAAGRLKTVPNILATAGILYDARGNQTNVARQNGATTVMSYSPERGWLLTLVTTSTAGTLQNYTYTRDGLGRINAVASPQAGDSWTYGYDDLDRLLSADNLTDNSFDQTFTYDLVGNMATNSKVGTYGYGAQGPGSVRPHATTGLSGGPLGSQTFLYDADGSMTCQGGSGPTCSGGDSRAMTARTAWRARSTASTPPRSSTAPTAPASRRPSPSPAAAARRRCISGTTWSSPPASTSNTCRATSRRWAAAPAARSTGSIATTCNPCAW